MVSNLLEVLNGTKEGIRTYLTRIKILVSKEVSDAKLEAIEREMGNILSALDAAILTLKKEHKEIAYVPKEYLESFNRKFTRIFNNSTKVDQLLESIKKGEIEIWGAYHRIRNLINLITQDSSNGKKMSESLLK